MERVQPENQAGAVPARRMKMRRPHTIPFPDGRLEIVSEAHSSGQRIRVHRPA